MTIEEMREYLGIENATDEFLEAAIDYLYAVRCMFGFDVEICLEEDYGTYINADENEIVHDGEFYTDKYDGELDVIAYRRKR